MEKPGPRHTAGRRMPPRHRRGLLLPQAARALDNGARGRPRPVPPFWTDDHIHRGVVTGTGTPVTAPRVTTGVPKREHARPSREHPRPKRELARPKRELARLNGELARRKWGLGRECFTPCGS